MQEQLERLAAERAPRDREAMLGEIAAYGETDLLCYRAGEPKLAALQTALFAPVLKALSERLHIDCVVTQGVMPVPQPEAAQRRLYALFNEARDHELAALFVLTPLFGSALLALALWKELISLDKAVECARVDEDFQAEKWVQDPEEQAAWQYKRQDMEICAFFLRSQASDNPN